MSNPTRLLPSRLPSRAQALPARAPLRTLASAAALVAGCLALPAQAVDFGPFSLTGFGKIELQRTTNACEDCQRELGEARHRVWADDLSFGKRFDTLSSDVTLFQPFLSFNQKLGGGWQVFGLLSQRWRDGKVDLEGWVYERNIGVAHEDWGRLTIGAMSTRGWSSADFPYSFKALRSDAWGGSGGFNTAFSDSGAGYGLLSRAVRYMSRPIDVEFFGGDVLLEATYDMGKSGWKRNKPQFLELYAKFIKTDMTVDVVVQSAKNGEPVAWGKAPFGGLTPFAQDDALLGGSDQGMTLLIWRQVMSDKVELSAGARFNRWSGAYAVQTTPGAAARWNSMFNVHWNGVDANGVPNPGYEARSTDLMLGLRYRINDKITASTGLVYLGRASTDNPSERGQSNTLTYGTLGLSYNFGHGLQFYGNANLTQYGRKGLAPLSMPSHSAFTNIDSRVANRGNALGIGATITF